jgi:hypothetical protein
MPRDEVSRGPAPDGPPADASDKTLWITRRAAARALGTDHRTVPKVAGAARVRVKKLPGITGERYFLPDICRVAGESVGVAGRKEAARPR